MYCQVKKEGMKLIVSMISAMLNMYTDMHRGKKKLGRNSPKCLKRLPLGGGIKGGIYFFIYIFQFFYNEHELLLQPEFYLVFLEHTYIILCSRYQEQTRLTLASPSQGIRPQICLGLVPVRNLSKQLSKLTLSSEKSRRWWGRYPSEEVACRSRVATTDPGVLITYRGAMGSS